MSMKRADFDLLDKARESLEGAESELVNERYNNATNRAYYACYQAAVHILRRKAPSQPKDGQWKHARVQAEFANVIKRQKALPTALRDVLSQLLFNRVQADYWITPVSEIQAHRSVRRARDFVSAIEAGES